MYVYPFPAIMERNRRQILLPELPFSVQFKQVSFEHKILYNIEERQLYTAVDVRLDDPAPGRVKVRLQGIPHYFDSALLEIYKACHPN
jgi:hypothetical protein